MRIHWLQHVPFEGLGAIEAWAGRRGHALSASRLWAGDAPPSPGSFDGLVVMGGPMSVHDEAQHPWLVPEKRLIDAALRADKPLFGVCLGAQLIADVLGARVLPNVFKEIGWFPVSLTPAARSLPLFQAVPDRFEPFHWHGETFDVPRGATRIAFSQACANQGFVHGPRVLAVQFHLEVARENVRALLENCSADVVPGPFVEPIGAMTNHNGSDVRAHALLEPILDRLFAPAP
jgi:GMP synthase-like glutamine amidotransferase